jgi:hypothetical protein
VKLLAGLPLEERIAAIGTGLFVLLGGILVAIQLQLNSHTLQQQDATYGQQVSQLIAAQVRFDTFNNEAVSLNATLQEIIGLPHISHARIIGLDGEILVAANSDQPIPKTSYRSEIAYDKSVIGYCEIFLNPSLADERETTLLFSSLALLFAASLLCYIFLRLGAANVSNIFKDIVQRIETGQDAPDYLHNDAYGSLIIQLFGERKIVEEPQPTTLLPSTVIAIRINDWSGLARQVDKLILEQIARQLQQCVEAVAERTMLPWEPAPGGFDITFTAEEFDASTAADSLVIAELLLRMQALVDQQRLREGKIPFAIGIGIGEVIPPSTNTQLRQPTLMSQLGALAKQQANFYASTTQQNSFMASDKFIQHWTLANVLEDPIQHENVRGVLMVKQLKAPYSDIVEQHFQAILKNS